MLANFLEIFLIPDIILHKLVMNVHGDIYVSKRKKSFRLPEVAILSDFDSLSCTQ